MTRHLITIALSLLATAASAADTLAVATAEHTARWEALPQGRSDNPALQAARFRTSYSEIRAGYDYTHASKALLPQTGRGEAFASVAADSYVRLSGRTAVWGGASYRTGRRHDVKWCSTADFLLLYPHVMGDTLGGRLTSERYTFSGGWASRMGRLTLGAGVRFRAEHEYRTTDPRPRDIVTDLTASLGATWSLARWTLGANLGAAFYKQTSSVKFFKEDGVIPEYQMVGLGMDYKRFSGSNTSAYYKATGWSGGLDIRRADGAGPRLSARYAYTPYRRILPNYNALPMTTLYVDRVQAEAAWRISGRRASWDLFATADYEHRSGDEHLAGNASASEYRVVADLTTYRCHDVTLAAGATADIPSARGGWTVTLRGGWREWAADYVSPHREMSVSKLFASGAAQWRHALAHGSLLTASAHADYMAGLSDRILMPYASMDRAGTLLVDGIHARLAADYVAAGASLRTDWPLAVKGLRGLFAEAQGGYTSSTDYGCVSLSLAVGLTF